MQQPKKASVQKNTPPDVTKEAVTSEMKSTIMNIQSLLQQLLAEEGAEYAPEAEPMKEAAMKAEFTPAEAPNNPNEPHDEDEEEKDGVMKAIIEGDPDASTASDSAEERVEDIPEWDEENVDDVAKAIMRMLTKSRKMPVAKSARPAKAESRDLVLLAVTKTLGQVTERLSQQDRVIKDMLEGMGVASVLEEHQVQKSVPVQSTDNSVVMKEFLNSLFEAAGQNGVRKDIPVAPVDAARKNLSEAARALRGFWPEA